VIERFTIERPQREQSSELVASRGARQQSCFGKAIFVAVWPWYRSLRYWDRARHITRERRETQQQVGEGVATESAALEREATEIVIASQVQCRVVSNAGEPQRRDFSTPSTPAPLLKLKK
jgi:hypothetical protein